MITALKQAGYNADWLKVKFKWLEEKEHQVTQPNTLARQRRHLPILVHMMGGSMQVVEEHT